MQSIKKWIQKSLIFQFVTSAFPFILSLWLITKGVQNKELLGIVLLGSLTCVLFIYKWLEIPIIDFEPVNKIDKATNEGLVDTGFAQVQLKVVVRNYTPVMIFLVMTGFMSYIIFGIGTEALSSGFLGAIRNEWQDGTLITLFVFACLFIAVPLFLIRYVTDSN